MLLCTPASGAVRGRGAGGGGLPTPQRLIRLLPLRINAVPRREAVGIAPLSPLRALLPAPEGGSQPCSSLAGTSGVLPGELTQVTLKAI